ncbi:PREDICTED: elongation factor 1-delta 2-like [Camelina sativa]|uniref:Elongation factor 1-delta 2-like n=1 Tax=Camelina sativa TaxID=90675 RepID=A0ABM0YTP9_CAMSA|nr:PREDICTED: elongation factor 1-delta 2-like [Camelina sativa]
MYDDDLFCFDTLVETHIYNCGRVRSVECSNFERCPANDDGDLLDEETEEEMKAAGISGLVLPRYRDYKNTDIKKEEERIRSIQKEGVSWGATKLFNLGYGFVYLRTMFTIIDDRVSLDTIRRKGLGVIPLNRI